MLPKEKAVLHFKAPTALSELSKNMSTVFSTLSNAMKSICNMYKTYFCQLTEVHEIKTEDGPFEHLGFALISGPYDVWNEEGNVDSVLDESSREDIRDFFEFCS